METVREAWRTPASSWGRRKWEGVRQQRGGVPSQSHDPTAGAPLTPQSLCPSTPPSPNFPFILAGPSLSCLFYGPVPVLYVVLGKKPIVPESGDQAAKVEKWAGAPAVRSSLVRTRVSGEGGCGRGEEDAEGTCVGRGCGEKKEDPGESRDAGGRTYLYSRCSRNSLPRFGRTP